MPVDYIHYILPYSKTTLLGNPPTFFYFGITLLPLKKKVLQTSRLMSNFEIRSMRIKIKKKGECVTTQKLKSCNNKVIIPIII